MRSPSRAVTEQPTSRLGVLLGALAVLVAACGGGTDAEFDALNIPTTAPDWLIERAGDATTTFEVSERSYNLSARNVGLSARIRFADGDEVFEALFDTDMGLGPDFNANSCTSCHVNNGRQQFPVENGTVGIGPVVHVSAPGATDDEAPFDLPGFGTRLQTFTVDGSQPEARINVTWETVDGNYPDGTPYELRRPIVSALGLAGDVPADAQLSLRIPPQVAGPGLLEYVPAEDIVAAADPNDADGDGISGAVNYVNDGRIGRHGWKADAADLVHQSANALAEDIGVGTSLIPVNGAIELSDEELADLAFYVEALAIPAGRDVDDPEVIRGANLFTAIGCADCHTPTQRTGTTQYAELDNLLLIPFTDLLLHDMGPGLDDGRRVYGASGSEWRTAPLWGIGLLDTVNGHVSLLHDGRARSIEEAILWHGGEAQHVTDAFMALSAEDRAALLRFVASR